MRFAARSARALLVPVALAALLALPSCDGDDGADVFADTINVTLDEFTVIADDDSTSDGFIRFDVTNAGSVNHEFVVVRTNLAASALPTNPDGSFQEGAAGTEVVDEIDSIPPGADEQITLDLDEGHYVLLCNMVGPAGGHYSLGMRMDFDVN
jgi:hypothetical protein